MVKLKLEIFFSVFLIGFFLSMMAIFLFLMMNNYSYIISWEIISIKSVFVELDILFDWISCSFSGLVCLISSCVCLFAVNYMKGDIHVKRFIFILMLFVVSMNFLIFIPSIVSLILGWDGLGLVSFCLVIYYQNNKSLSAGMLTVLMNRVGDCFILGGVSIMIVMGHFNYLCMWDFYNLELCMMFIVIAGMTKSAQIPFSSWLPAAMAAPTPVSALVHSSTLVTAGVYLLIRFFDFLLYWDMFCCFLLFISIMTTFMSGICAVYEYDMKKIIALSTLSQLGVMMMSLSLKMPMLSLFHLYTHAMFKALLFLCGGNIIHNYGGLQDIRDVSGVGYYMPMTGVIMNVCNMALCGFPFLAGFYSKDLIMEILLSSSVNLFMGMLGVTGVCLTMLYSMRMSLLILWGESKSMKFENMGDTDNLTVYSMLVLCVGAIFGGWLFQCFVLSFNEVVILPVVYKLLVMVLLIISLLWSFSLWVGKGTESNISVFTWMHSSMWFFPTLSGYPFVSLVSGVSNFSLSVLEMGWLEMVSGKGLFIVINKIIGVMEWWMFISFNINLVVFAVLLIMI
uniref:NADH-ubiquinone oxidoreductase chain 5 n=1 Tax=Tremoctopus violaceus TaxID=102883 RepID=A0A3S6PTV1_9MOLL|nr:NADH dehydrogenase subunit 5 [Tremoctopus violaceus]ATR85798.1 NADH dehydrogenase subunit 5 [Tremoctopus violaceus]WBK26779.1 NADH dehydrogenase subunit 5 [Tremoctopus violaceus]